MAINKNKKREIVAKIADALKEAVSVVFVGFTRLTVAEASKMRKQLAQAGVRYFVAKKTLLRLALKQHGYEGEEPALPGEVAIAWTKDDVIAPARGVYEFGKNKKLKGTLTLLGGIFEGMFANAEKMVALATIPSMPVLRGMFVNIINSPRSRFAVALAEVAKTKTI